MRKYLGLLLILAVILAACVPVPVATPEGLTERGLQPTEVNSLRVRQTLDVAGATTLAALAPTSLTVSGATALNGGLTMDTSAFTVADATGNTVIAGTLAANGGITVDTSNFTVNGSTGAVSTAAALSALSATVGGGFGATGCSISDAGVLQCDGAATLGSTLAVTGVSSANGGLTVGGGYGSTGCTVSDAGVLQCNGAATVDGALTATGLLSANSGIAVDTSAFTVADTTGNTVIAGTLAANGGITVDTSNFTVDGTTGAVSSAAGVSALSATIGGGFGATGCSISAAGAVSCDGAVILGSTLNVTSTVTLVGDLVSTKIKPSASGSAAANNYCMSSDCDTGLWYPGDNIIGLATEGTERARVTNSGLSVTGDVAATTGTFAGNVTITETLIFEGATDNTVETIVTVTDPTSADKTITLPNASGTVALISGATTLVVGSSTITGTGTVVHGLTTPLFVLCTIGTPVQEAAQALCSGVITSTTVTLNVWAVDGVTPGVAANTLVYWQVAGTP
jgi:hypothetical protein